MDNQKFLELTMIFFFIILPLVIAIITSIPLITYIYSIYTKNKSNKDLVSVLDFLYEDFNKTKDLKFCIFIIIFFYRFVVLSQKLNL